MHIETQIDHEKAIRTHRVTGLVTLQEFNSLLSVIYNSAEIDPKMPSFWDVREADFTAVTPQDIRAFAEFVRVNWVEKSMNRAAIVVTGLSDFAVSRMYEQVLGPATAGKVMVFWHPKSAMDWLEGKAKVATPPMPTAGTSSKPPH